MDTDKIVADLKSASGWQRIEYVNDTFVVALDIGDMRMIKGLKQGNDCLYFSFEQFKGLPISFVVNVGGTIHQYWTINDRLHRRDGAPAYVSYDPSKKRVIRRWYWNGLPHRIGGPAKDMVQGYETGEIEGLDGHFKETWDYRVMEWYQEGFQCKFPFPASCKMEKGINLKDKKTRKVDSPRGDLAAFTAESTTFDWKSNGPRKEFWPTWAEFTDLAEWYEQGQFQRRAAAFGDVKWSQGASTFEASDLTHFNEEFRTGEMFSMVDLWGEFYSEDTTEFVLLTEFERIGKDSE